MTGILLGRDATLSLNGGTHGAPTWAPIPQVSELTAAGAWDSADGSTRESAVKMGAKTLVDISVSGKVKFAPGDTNQVTLVEAFFNPTTVVDVMVLNGPSTLNGAYGVRYDAQVVNRDEDHGITMGIFMGLKVQPVPSVNAPSWAKVVTGAPVFTTL